MGDIFVDILCSGIGRIYLWCRYRDSERRNKILQIEFGNSYSVVGKKKLLQAVALFMAALMGFFLLAILMRFIRIAFL